MLETRTATWENLGEDVQNCKTLDSVLEKSGLDFNVVKTPIFTEIGASRVPIERTMATVIEGTDKVLGIVSKKYEVCQNREAFDFINYISDDLKFKKAGMTSSGLVYIISELPEVNILGDSFKPHVIYQNGFNGGISIKAAICPLRLVCQNQFNISFKETNNTVSIRHTSTMQSKLVQAREVLRNTADYMSTLNKEAEKYVGIKLSQKQLEDLINDFFPITDKMSDRTKASIERKKIDFMRAYNCDDNSNFRGTAWGIINAISDYVTHYQPRSTEKALENRFTYVTFAPALDHFMKLLLQRV